MNADVVVIGGGTLGTAIAYGLASRNVKVLVLDGGDNDFRAANANFGLVWLQGKGLDMPEYHQLSLRSVEMWPAFSAELAETTSIDLQNEHNGGLSLCFSADEFEQRRSTLMRLHNQVGGARPGWEMLDRSALAKLLPKVPFGPDVVGASYGLYDGHCNPLRLLTALQRGIVRKGGELRGGNSVQSIRSDGQGGFLIDLGTECVTAARVVIAAGLGTKALAAQIGLDIPMRPQRGQILVTERVAPFLPLPMSSIRQTREGTIMIGATQEEVGLDTSTTTDAASSLSAKAIRGIPALKDARLVRQWAGLRIVTPDWHPIYAESESHPGAFVAICHSGVTLAPAHAALLAESIAAGRLHPSLDVFHHRRFDVPQAA
jgi:glycine/D-amino acid oxidase-like deaminating enzyme